MANAAPEVPVQDLSTEWGTLHAVCTRPDKLWFTTRPHSGRPGSQLLVHRVAYDFHLELVQCDPDCPMASFAHLAETWHSEMSLRRGPGHGIPTSAAVRVVRDQLIPVIREWLTTDTATEFRRTGESYWRQKICTDTDDVEKVLTQALRRIRQLRDVALSAAMPDEREVSWLRDVRTDRVLR